MRLWRLYQWRPIIWRLLSKRIWYGSFALRHSWRPLLGVTALALPVGLTAGSEQSAKSRRIWSPIPDVIEAVGAAVVTLESAVVGQWSMGKSAGSGFVVRADGVIVTNAHVVQGLREVAVVLQSGEQFVGRVLAVDPAVDLAVVKIPAADLPTLRWGDSDDVRPGEWVVAMGSPLFFSNTATAGIVSAVHRSIPDSGRAISYIQTDAVVIQGNSGGPLVNMDGEVVGINNMMAATGISFAIPANYARQFVEQALQQLATRGRHELPLVSRTFIGIHMLSLSKSMAQQLRRANPTLPDVQTGVLVWDVIARSPADRAGLRPGDVIVNANDRAVATAEDLYRTVRETPSVSLTVLRGRERFTVSLSAVMQFH